MSQQKLLDQAVTIEDLGYSKNTKVRDNQRAGPPPPLALKKEAMITNNTT